MRHSRSTGNKANTARRSMGSTMRALSRGVSPDALLVNDPASGTGPSAALRRLVPRSVRRDHDSSSTLIADSAAARNSATPEAEWHPQARLVAAVESVRTERTHRSVFSCAKVVQVLSGRARIETEEGPHLLGPGMNFMIGTGRWCSVVPLPSVRMWTIYLDEDFLRHHMWWVFAGRERVGVPAEWDGRCESLEVVGFRGFGESSVVRAPSAGFSVCTAKYSLKGCPTDGVVPVCRIRAACSVSCR